jgi:hypothetical protein
MGNPIGRTRGGMNLDRPNFDWTFIDLESCIYLDNVHLNLDIHPHVTH